MCLLRIVETQKAFPRTARGNALMESRMILNASDPFHHASDPFHLVKLRQFGYTQAAAVAARLIDRHIRCNSPLQACLSARRKQRAGMGGGIGVGA